MYRTAMQRVLKASGEHLMCSRRIHRKENFHVEKNRDGSRARITFIPHVEFRWVHSGVDGCGVGG